MVEGVSDNGKTAVNAVNAGDATSGVDDPVVAAAIEEFAAKGFAGARVDEIARRAGVNKATLYYRVGDKDALYLVAMRRLFTPLAASLGRPLDTVGGPRERLAAHIGVIAAAILTTPHLSRIIMREIADHGQNLPDEILGVLAGSLKRLKAILNEGAAVGDFIPVEPMVVHAMVVGAFNFIAASAPVRATIRDKKLSDAPTVTPTTDPGRIGERVAAIVINGLVPPQESSQ
jgi:AcrR family transcriptional regulator